MTSDRPDEPPRLREPDPPEPPPPAGPSPVPAAIKSRAIGCVVILAGAAALAAIPVIGVMPKKVFVALLALGPVGLMMGLGMIIVPWTDEMFALNDQEDVGKFFRAMPPVWKVWFVLSIGVMLAILFAALIWF
jgi:hypothetical protein